MRAVVPSHGATSWSGPGVSKPGRRCTRMRTAPITKSGLKTSSHRNSAERHVGVRLWMRAMRRRRGWSTADRCKVARFELASTVRR